MINRYSPRQIGGIYEQIIKREADEVNLRYQTLKSAICGAFDEKSPDKIVGQAQDKKKDKPKDFSKINLGGEDKNYNPNLKVFNSKNE